MTTTRDEWTALAELCETAKVPDREIDCALSRIFPEGKVIPYTASLDAITALIERELPGIMWAIRRHEYNKSTTVHLGTSATVSLEFRVHPALALCAAFCRAMAEKTTP